MRVILIHAAALLLLVGVPHTAAAQGGYCYKCEYPINYPFNQCMDCWHPVVWGNVSCIPYCNGTCSVGGSCEAALIDLRMSPDGSLLTHVVLVEHEQDPLAGTSLGVTPPIEYARNCHGLVIARTYRSEAVATIRARTRRIEV